MGEIGGEEDDLKVLLEKRREEKKRKRRTSVEGSKVSSFRKAGQLERTSLLFPSALKGLCTFISSLDMSMNPIVEDPPSPERSLEEEEEEDEEGECELVVDRGAAE